MLTTGDIENFKSVHYPFRYPWLLRKFKDQNNFDKFKLPISIDKFFIDDNYNYRRMVNEIENYLKN